MSYARTTSATAYAGPPSPDRQNTIMESHRDAVRALECDANQLAHRVAQLVEKLHGSEPTAGTAKGTALNAVAPGMLQELSTITNGISAAHNAIREALDRLETTI